MIALLWLLQAGLFGAAVLFDWRDAAGEHAEARVSLALRIGISASLVLAAAAVWRSGGPAVAYCAWAAWGMLWGCIGDLVMARLIPSPNRLVGGMLAFGIGHGFYIAAAAAAVASGALANAGFWTGIVAYLGLTLVAWNWGIRTGGKAAVVNAGALLYGLWIGVMASCMLGLATARGGTWWIAAAGGLSFVLSDLLIGLTEIGTTRIRHAHDWIWATYLAGQMGIVYAGWLGGS